MPPPGRLGGPGQVTRRGAWAVACARNCSCCWWHMGENKFGFYPCRCACLEEGVPRAGQGTVAVREKQRMGLLCEDFWGIQADLIFPYKIYLNSKLLRVVF